VARPGGLGWPLTVATVAGLALVSFRREHGYLLLAVPVVSYALTLVAVVGYVYDRFLLGVLVVFAIWAGVALDRLGSWTVAGRRVGLALAGLTISVTVLYSGSVDVAMQR